MDYNKNIIDLTFGISNQALAVAAMLNDLEPDFLYLENEGKRRDDYSFETTPFYSGREKGIVISFIKNYGLSGQQYNVWIYEHRNTDGLVATAWEGKTPFNNLWTTDDIPNAEERYENGTWHDAEEDWGNAGLMAQKVMDLFESKFKEWMIDMELSSNIEKAKAKAKTRKLESVVF